jgi:hypothetical protein
MRLYAKLALFIMSFLILAGAGARGEPAREWAWETSFAARCHAAYVLGDQRLEDRLVAEAGVELRRRMERQMILAEERAPAVAVISSADGIRISSDAAPGAALAWCDGTTEPVMLR